MATFEAQVEGLTSLSIDSSSAPNLKELDQFLTDGAKEVINLLPENLLPLCTSSVGFTSGSASTLNTGKVLHVLRSDGDISQPCRSIPAIYKGKYSDSDDMNYATVTDPVFYVENNTIDVLPAGGSCTYSEVQYPSVAYGDSLIGATSLTGVTATAVDPTVFTKSSHGLSTGDIVKLSNFTEMIEINGMTGTVTRLDANTFEVDGVSADPAETTGGNVVKLGGFPDEAEYLVPLYASIKSLQNAMGNKTSDLPSDISFPSIPVTPADPSFDTGAISVSSSAPTYTSPVFSAPTLATVGDLTLPVTPTVPTISAQSVTITGTAPAYVGPSYSQIDTYIDTDEDVELAQAKLQEVSSQIQDSLNRFNDANVEYQAKLQKDLQDTQLSDANEARKLQKYSNEVQTYSAEVNARVQEWVNEEWTQKFQKYQQDYSLKLQEYNTNLQNALNNFNKENTLYQNELQEKIREANNQQTKDSAEYSAKLQKYSNEMQSYSAEVNKSVQDFNTKLQKHSTDYQWLQSQYAQLKSDYNYGLQLLLGRPLAAAQQQRR
jgi:hypothetical protein